MSTTMERYWERVSGALVGAHSIAFDGCHKTYVLMDEGQTEQMRAYGYGDQSADGGDGSALVLVSDVGRSEALRMLRDWFEGSCWLRFIHAVSTVDGDPNEGFTNLIPQGAGEDDDEREDDWL